MSRRRFTAGLSMAALAGVLGVAVYTAAAWIAEAGPDRLLFVLLPEWQLILCAHLISGAAAVTGMVLLVPPLIDRISKSWHRRVMGVLVVLVGAAAAVPWLVYFVGIGLNAASGTYTKVSGETGESVIVLHSGFDRTAYTIYGQETAFLWKQNVAWQTSSGVFQADNCTLVVRAEDLLLACGADRVSVPQP
jgi:hypothetical protein